MKAELEKAQSRNSELEKSLAKEKQLRVEETRKLKESAGNTEFQLTSVQHELEELTKKTDTWLKELCRINSELNSKLFYSFLQSLQGRRRDVGERCFRCHGGRRLLGRRREEAQG